jgi:hypothetical protein
LTSAGDFYTRDRKDKEEDDEPDPKRVKSRKITSCTPRVASDGQGRTAGTVNAFWVCGFMFPPEEMIPSESTTHVRTLVFFVMLFISSAVPPQQFIKAAGGEVNLKTILHSVRT